MIIIIIINTGVGNLAGKACTRNSVFAVMKW